jgi:hypothetical protein
VTYKEQRAKAIANLGGKCVECGATEDLEIDHIEAGSRRAAALTNSRPTLKAVNDAARGETYGLQLLCHSHHQAKTTIDRKKVTTSTDEVNAALNLAAKAIGHAMTGDFEKFVDQAAEACRSRHPSHLAA